MILLALAPRGVSAAPPPRDPEQIMRGMSYQDVLAIWGTPVEKQEMESRREERWIYPTIEVRFREGRVQRAGWREHVAVPQKKTAPSDELLEEELPAFSSPAAKVPVEDILNEIVESGGEQPAPANPAGPGRPGILERR